MEEKQIDLAMISELYLNSEGGITIVGKYTGEVYDYDNVMQISEQFIINK